MKNNSVEVRLYSKDEFCFEFQFSVAEQLRVMYILKNEKKIDLNNAKKELEAGVVYVSDKKIAIALKGALKSEGISICGKNKGIKKSSYKITTASDKENFGSKNNSEIKKDTNAFNSDNPAECIAALEQEIKEIRANFKKIYIVNAGRMNHGKSSLFNSLMDKYEFITGDIRTTVEQKSVEFCEDVYFIDTPGLDAEEYDDKVAFDAYKKANMIIFVHTPNAGELHSDEIKNIKAMERLFPDKVYFQKHFCIVLTFLDGISGADADAIENKIRQDLSRECGFGDLKIFRVSNSRYQKGKKENKETLVAKSGIVEFREFLLTNIEKWKSETKNLQESKIDSLCTKLSEGINRKKEEVNSRLQENTDKNRNTMSRLLKMINDYYGELESIGRDISSAELEIENMRTTLRQLKEQHENERRRYY